LVESTLRVDKSYYNENRAHFFGPPGTKEYVVRQQMEDINA